MGDEETGPALLAKVRELAAFVRESKYAVVCIALALSSFKKFDIRMKGD